MPQASEALRAKWGGQQGVGEDKAIAHLESRGFKLTRQWTWERPNPSYTPDEEDCEAMTFLICEWDYGELAE